MSSRILPAFITFAACTLFLSGCTQPHRHDSHASPGSSMHHGHGMNMKSMCGHYGQMSPEERKAYREAHHGQLSPQQHAQHEQHMQDKCARVK